MKKEVILAMSGGVDSSVALYLLLEDGYTVKGVTMQNGSLSHQEMLKAEQAAKRFNIHWDVLHVEKEFEEMVIKPFISDYTKGFTPNPCAICNKTIKFGFLFDIMQKRYPDASFATGHYARTAKKGHDIFLREAVDSHKDQSYFLATIRPGILNRLIFPIGNYHKREIIQIAKKRSFISDTVSESQDICFIHGNDYKSFLQQRGVEGQRGKIINENGEVLGFHEGLFNYTIGQRRGLGITYKERLFVKEMNPRENNIVLMPLKEMYDNHLRASQLNRFDSEARILELSKKMLKCKVKSGSQAHDCQIAIDAKHLRVFFKEAVYAITPGQLCVIYDNEGMIIISGIIQQNQTEVERNNQVHG